MKNSVETLRCPDTYEPYYKIELYLSAESIEYVKHKFGKLDLLAAMGQTILDEIEQYHKDKAQQ